MRPPTSRAPTRLETPRLLLRDWTLDDLDALASICADAEVMRYVRDGEPWSRDTTAAWLHEAQALAMRVGYCRWALLERTTTKLLGFCGFVPSDDSAEIGWRLARAAWGFGYATEAAHAALDHGFGTLGFRRVTALVQTPNRASLRVCEKLGMHHERCFLRNGREVNVLAISRERADD